MEIAERISFLDIDSQTRASLSEFLRGSNGAIDGIIGDFYKKIAQVPHLQALFTPETQRHAQSMQVKHWTESVFSGNFNDDYMRQVIKIGRTHQRIGLAPQWYMGGYCFALIKLVQSIMATNRKKPERAAEQVSAIIKAIFLDMELAVSVYIDASHQEAHDTLSRHADKFDAEVKGLVELVAAASVELQTISESMAHTADVTAEKTNEVAEDISVTSRSIETVAAATTELSASIEEISRQASAVRTSTSNAMSDASEVKSVMSQLSLTVNDINSAAREVTEISNRTRLLALNATIESARAGEHGRGFAVVAGEVKSLADQAARVTDNIISRIQAVEAGTSQALQAVERVNDAIAGLHSISSAIAAAVEEQGVATQEISRSVNLASDSSQGISSAVSMVAQATRETGYSAGTVKQSSSELSGQADALSRKVNSFLDQLKAV